MKVLNRNLGVVGLFAVLLIGCGKDRTVDDAKARDLANRLAQTDAVAGTYQGILYSKSGGQALGALSIEFSADTRGGSTTDPTTSQRQVATAQINFTDKSGPRPIASGSGYYDAYSELYQFDIPVQYTATQSVIVSFAGKLSGGQMVGRVEAVGFRAFGGTYSLSRGASLPQIEPSESNRTRIEKVLTKNYQGPANVPGSGRSIVHLVFNPHIGTADQDFLELFYPIRVVNFVVTLDGGWQSDSFTAGLWDTRSKTLKGERIVKRGSENEMSDITVQCNEKIVGKKDGWECIWTNDSTSFKFTAMEAK